ncbi:MAG: hypothetical protein LBT11_02075 [Treponema sp.]|jgi:hypothetical protein|nr:hypothetical protein [Treponema sp.]
MTVAVAQIVRGRRGLRTKGETENGLAYFTDGLQRAKAVFTEVQGGRDLYLMLLAEYIYVGQELASSSNEEKEARSSCEAAMHDFDDAFLALEAVQESPGYVVAEKTYPHKPKYRYRGMPRDAFHDAYMAHRTRVGNTLRKIGLNPDERSLTELRIAAFAAAQQVYLEKQQAALSTAAVPHV